MSFSKPNKIKALIKTRCKEVESYGYTIEENSLFGGFFNKEKGIYVSLGDKRICPIMACLLGSAQTEHHGPIEDAAILLDIREADVWGFIHGWDGAPTEQYEDGDSAKFYAAGQQLRKEILP